MDENDTSTELLELLWW